MDFHLRENYSYEVVVFFFTAEKLYHRTEPLKCFKTKMSHQRCFMKQVLRKEQIN